jgi:hypothetical protein
LRLGLGSERQRQQEELLVREDAPAEIDETLDVFRAAFLAVKELEPAVEPRAH